MLSLFIFGLTFLSSTYAAPGECGGTKSHTNTIHRGIDVNKGDWPWLVPLFRRTGTGTEFICAGTLVSRKHIVTAAHCIRPPTPNTPQLRSQDILAYPGKYSLFDSSSQETQTRRISEFIIHPRYNVDSVAQDSDIAVLVMAEPVTYTDMVYPICLWNNVANTNLGSSTGSVIGWGRNEERQLSDTPKLARLNVVTNDVCLNSHTYFRNSGIVTSKTVCAGNRDGTGPCHGDSGGGLYVVQSVPSIGERWVIRGVVSKSLEFRSTGGCNLYQYAVMTDVSKFLPWLRCVIPVENDIGMVKLNGKYYYFSDRIKESLNWHSANEFCQAHGLQLASIQDWTENVAVSAFARNILGGSFSFWIGGNSEEDNSTWKWQGLGTNVTLFNWAEGEPGGHERCLGTNPGDGNVNWHDIPCTKKFRFICEQEDTCPGL